MRRSVVLSTLRRRLAGLTDRACSLSSGTVQPGTSTPCTDRGYASTDGLLVTALAFPAGSATLGLVAGCLFNPFPPLPAVPCAEDRQLVGSHLVTSRPCRIGPVYSHVHSSARLL